MKLGIQLSLVLMALSFASCAYTETINEREQERQGLQRDLDFEIEKGKKLTR